MMIAEFMNRYSWAAYCVRGRLDLGRPLPMTLAEMLERDEGRVRHAYRGPSGLLDHRSRRLIDERKGGGLSDDGSTTCSPTTSGARPPRSPRPYHGSPASTEPVRPCWWAWRSRWAPRAS